MMFDKIDLFKQKSALWRKEAKGDDREQEASNSIAVAGGRGNSLIERLTLPSIAREGGKTFDYAAGYKEILYSTINYKTDADYYEWCKEACDGFFLYRRCQKKEKSQEVIRSLCS